MPRKLETWCEISRKGLSSSQSPGRFRNAFLTRLRRGRLCPAVSPAQTPETVDPRRSTSAAPHFATGLRPHLTPTPAASRSVSGAMQMNRLGGSAPLPALARGAPAMEPSRSLRPAADQKSVGRCSGSEGIRGAFAPAKFE